MVRTMTASMKAAVSLQRSEVIHLLAMELSGGTIRFTTGSSNIAWDGQTWNASGSAMSFEAVQETPDISGQSLRVVLDGVSLTAISALLAEDYVGRNATLYRAHISAGSIIADPTTLFLGLMNEAWEVTENVDKQYAKVETTIASPLVKLKQKRGIRADLNSHQKHYTTDTFFSHIVQIPKGDIGWGFWRPSWQERYI